MVASDVCLCESEVLNKYFPGALVMDREGLMAQVLGKMSVILDPLQTGAFTRGPGPSWAGWSQGPRPWALAESGLCSLSPRLHTASLPSALHLAQNVTCARAALPAEITLSVLFTWSWVILHIAAGECFFASRDGLTPCTCHHLFRHLCLP